MAKGVSFRVIVETEIPCSYDDAYAALAAPDFLIPAILPSLFWFDPLGVEETAGTVQKVEEFPWFDLLVRFGETVEPGGRFDIEFDASRPRNSAANPRKNRFAAHSRALFTGRFIQEIVEFSWNPLSLREASALQSTLQWLAAFFSTVIDALRSIYAAISQRIRIEIDGGLYCEPRLVSRHTNDVQVDAQELVELYLARSVRVGMVETWKPVGVGSDQCVGSVYGIRFAGGENREEAVMNSR